MGAAGIPLRAPAARTQPAWCHAQCKLGKRSSELTRGFARYAGKVSRQALAT